MFSVSFRILLRAVAGTTIYLNGSLSHDKPIKKGELIFVRGLHSDTLLGETAEVIESVHTTRDPGSYKWRLA